MAILHGERVVQVLEESAAAGGTAQIDLLQLAAVEIRKAGPPYTSVYMYIVAEDGGDLVLEAFSGRPTEHTRIPAGHGVCGSAVALAEDQIVGDVTSRPDYISCSPLTKSELVVLIRDPHDRIIGQIDIDSDHIHPFSPDEVDSVRFVAHALGTLLSNRRAK